MPVMQRSNQLWWSTLRWSQYPGDIMSPPRVFTQCSPRYCVLAVYLSPVICDLIKLQPCSRHDSQRGWSVTLQLLATNENTRVTFYSARVHSCKKRPPCNAVAICPLGVEGRQFRFFNWILWLSHFLGSGDGHFLEWVMRKKSERKLNNL